MGYLLSVGVITFQVVIFMTIIASARMGKGAFSLTALAWTVFTLFGSIFTAGLLLLQLATIFVAYSIGNRRHRPPAAREDVPPAKGGSALSGWVLAAIIIFAGIATGKFFGRESADDEFQKLRQVRAARELTQDPVGPPSPIPAPRLRTAEEEAQDEEARRRFIENTPELAR